MTDLLTRASIKIGMLRMGEPIALGSDADIIEELAEEVARFGTALEAIAAKDTDHPGDGDYSRGWMDTHPTWSRMGPRQHQHRDTARCLAEEGGRQRRSK